MKSVLTPESKQEFGQENEKQSNSGNLKEASFPIYDKKYEACLNQTACINRGIEDIISIINAPNATPQDLQKVDEAKCENADSKHLDNNGTGSIAQPDFIKNPDYKFTVIKNEAFDIDVMLKSLYQELNKKYISCSCNQFCNVFISSNPRPVVWLKSYSALSYLIQLMKGRFIETPGNISIYKVATKYFHKVEIGRHFDPHRFKCEVKDLSKCDKAYLDRCFKYLRIKGNRYNAHSNDLRTNLSDFEAKSGKKNLNKLKEYRSISPANSTRQLLPPAF